MVIYQGLMCQVVCFELKVYGFIGDCGEGGLCAENEDTEFDDGRLKALTAAAIAADGAWLGKAFDVNDGALEDGGGGGGGGGGGVARCGGASGAAEGGGGGGGGAEGVNEVLGGGGGATGGARLLDEGGSGGGIGDAEEGGGGGAGGGLMLDFLVVGGGGGALPMGNIADEGFDNGFGGTFLKLASGLGTAGDVSTDTGLGRKPLIRGIEGAEPPGSGGGGAELIGGLGALGLDVSESECDASAPVEMPPLVFLSFGMPPANSPPSCGASARPASIFPLPAPVSLLLLARFPRYRWRQPGGSIHARYGGCANSWRSSTWLAVQDRRRSIVHDCLLKGGALGDVGE